MRLVTLMSILAALDMTFVVLCGMKVLEAGPSVLVLFGFEVSSFSDVSFELELTFLFHA